MQKLAIIGAGPNALMYAKAAREMGVQTHSFAWEKGAIAKDFVDQFHPISITETDRIVELCKAIGINGVISTTEVTLVAASEIASCCGLAHLNVATAKTVLNKHENRKKCEGLLSIKQPRFAIAHNQSELASHGLSYPLVIKPLDTGGKYGVTLVPNSESIQELADWSMHDSGKSFPLLLEEYVPGDEYSVESLSCNGVHHVVQITKKISSGAPHFLELGHDQPSGLDSSTQAAVRQAIDDVLTRLNYNNGPSHIEVKIHGCDIYLIELNARAGGDYIAEKLTRLSTGYSYLQGVIEIAMGIFQGANHAFERYAGIRFLMDQTKELTETFNMCEGKDWLVEKHVEGNGELVQYTHNNSRHTNYLVYQSDVGCPEELLLNTHTASL